MTDPRKPERFWTKVRIGKSDECWPWMRSKRPNGYGAAWCPATRRVWVAHRLAWVLSGGSDPGRLDVCHSCDNRECCNPAHLWLGTRQENMRDCVEKGRGYRPAGELSMKAKFTEAEVREIRKMDFSALGISQREYARRMGVSNTAIVSIRAGRTWRCVA